ncbi:hypothetical protein ACRRTK_012400 [Alexandromys fortis]
MTVFSATCFRLFCTYSTDGDTFRVYQIGMLPWPSVIKNLPYEDEGCVNI